MMMTSQTHIDSHADKAGFRMPGNLVLSIFSLIGAGALLGVSTNMAKVASQAGLSPLAFLTWSILGAAIILGAYAYSKGSFPKFSFRTSEYFVIAAFVTVAASNLLFFTAVPHVGVSFVILAITLPPLLTYVGALLLKMERFDKQRAGGVLAALAGAAFLAIQQLSAPDAPAFWILLTLVGPVLLAIGNLYRTVRWPVGEQAEGLAPGMLGAAAVMLLLTSLLPGFSVAVPTESTAPILIIAIQAVIFAAQFLLMFVLQKTGGPVLLSLLGAVGAVVGVPVAILLLGEAAPRGLVVGAALIALGVALVALNAKKN